MNAKQLKNSILQWAIQGRLVPQDPNDEPASVLLEKIRAEKARLVKEGKLKKKDLEEKPIAEDEIPFEIPKGWEWCRMSDLFNFIDYRGSTPTKIDSGIPLVTAKNVKMGYNDYSIKDYISIEEFESRKSRGVSKKGDLLFTTEAPLGNVSIADLDKFSAGQRLITLQSFRNELVNNKLIMFFMLSDTFQKSLIEKKTGTTVAGIKASKLKEILIPLPPLAEQHRIVAKIEELMPLVEKYGKAQDTLDEWNKSLPEKLKKSILQEAIQGRLVPQDPSDEPASALLERIRAEKVRLVKEGKLKKKDLEVKPIEEDEIPFEIPDSWEWVRYKDIANCELGKTKNPNEPLVNLRPYLCAVNVYWNKIDLTKLKEMPFSINEMEKYSIKKGDMLICEGGEAGRTAIWSDEGRTVFYQNALHRVRFYADVEPCFYMYQMYLYKTTGFLHDFIKGETIQHFVLGKLQSLPIPLPPLSEQKRIVAKVEELFGVMKK